MALTPMSFTRHIHTIPIGGGPGFDRLMNLPLEYPSMAVVSPDEQRPKIFPDDKSGFIGLLHGSDENPLDLWDKQVYIATNRFRYMYIENLRTMTKHFYFVDLHNS